MLCVRLQLASAVQYLERSLFLLVTSASDTPVQIIKFCSVFFGVTSRPLPDINKIPWCVALRRPSPAINKRHRLVPPGLNVTNLPRSVGTLFTTTDGRAVGNIYATKLDIGSNQRFLHSAPAFDVPVTGIRSSEYCQFAITFGKEKLEWCGHPTAKKSLRI